MERGQRYSSRLQIMEKYLYLIGYWWADKSLPTEKRLEKHQPSHLQLEMVKLAFITLILGNSEYIPMDTFSKISTKDMNQCVQMDWDNT